MTATTNDPLGWIQRPPESVSQAINEAVGAASVCWESMSGTGVFDSDRALAIARQLEAFIAEHTATDDLLAWVEELLTESENPMTEGVAAGRYGVSDEGGGGLPAAALPTPTDDLLAWVEEQGVPLRLDRSDWSGKWRAIVGDWLIHVAYGPTPAAALAAARAKFEEAGGG